MKNIFENAYFGKPYRTRDERKAIFICKQDAINLLIIEGYEEADEFSDDGEFVYDTSQHQFDIVSEWEEPIDEDELDKMAIQYACDSPITRVYEGEIEAFKAGYRRAKEG